MFRVSCFVFRVSCFVFRVSLFICLSISAEAQIRTQKHGDWKDCKVWPSGRWHTPKPTEHVQLDHVIKLTKDQNVGELSLGTNGSLNLNGFGIGLGGADTSSDCCVDLYLAHAGRSYMTMWTFFRYVHTSWGSKSYISDGSNSTVYSVQPKLEGSGDDESTIGVRLTATEPGAKHKDYRVVLYATLTGRIYRIGDARADCDFFIYTSNNKWKLMDTAKSYHTTNPTTIDVSMTIGGHNIYNTGSNYAYVIFKIAQDSKYDDLDICKFSIKDIRVTATCR